MSRLYALFALPFAATIAVAQTPCDQLKLSLPDTTIKSIESVPAGPFEAPAAELPDVAAPAPAAPGRGRGRRLVAEAAARQPPCRLTAGCRWC